MTKAKILFGGLLIAAFNSGAADYPSRPIRIVVSFGAGSISDILARTVSVRLSDLLKQQVVVDNRPGAGGNIGGEAVATATPDGYTIMLAPASVLSINQSLYSSMPYNSATAFAPIAQMSTNCNVLVINPSLPAKSVNELIAFGKRNPGKLNFASVGAGGTVHLSGELFKSMTGIEMVHIAYKASPLAHIDIIGGQVQIMFDTIPTALPQINAGKFRALGVTAARRSQLLPDLPTIAESGLAGYEAVNFNGFVAPAGTPRDIISKLNREIVHILNLPEVKENLLKIGAEPAPSSPEALAQLIKVEAAKWGGVVKALGLKIE